tara:strand:- start:1934 stop:2998 length:1065 start_codon:yes stop_codon:yes gene_type:complete
MNEATLYKWQVLRSSAEVPDSVFEPITQTDIILVDASCSALPINNPEYLYDMIAVVAFDGIRAAPGMPYDHKQIGGSWETQGQYTTLGHSLCRRVDIKPHPDKEKCYLVEIEISTMGRQYGSGVWMNTTTGAPPIRVHFNSQVAMRPGFRIADSTGALNIPGDTEVDTSVTPNVFDWTAYNTELGGKMIDFAGKPANVQIDQMVVTIEHIRRWPILDWDGNYYLGDLQTPATGENRICIGTSRNVTGARNTDSMLGFDKGTMRCTSLGALPLHHEFKLYQYSFLYDEQKHTTQFIPMVAQGDFKTVEDPAGIRGMQAMEVYANQPYMDAFQWSQTFWNFTDYEWDYLESFGCGA